MKLYIANCTKQNRVINFRLDFGRDGMLITDPRLRQHRSLPIPSGGILDVPGIVHASQAQTIMEQLEEYGARQITDKNRLPRAVVPYLMSVEERISPKLIAEVLMHNNGVKATEGNDRRRAAAISSADAVTRAVSEQQQSERLAETRNHSLEILQQTDRDMPDPPGPITEDGFKVGPAVAQQRNNKGRRANA